MGVYLSTPKTDKLSADGENSRVRFGLSSMQGWRTTMEDAVSCFRFPSRLPIGLEWDCLRDCCSVPCWHSWDGNDLRARCVCACANLWLPSVRCAILLLCVYRFA